MTAALDRSRQRSTASTCRTSGCAHVSTPARRVRGARRGAWTGAYLPERVAAQPPAARRVAAALCLVGVLDRPALPSSRDGEIAELRAEVRSVGIALLDHQSASERLLGVAWAQRAARAPQVVNALLERVQYDPNSSVRLAAIEALRARLDQPEVDRGPRGGARPAGLAAAPGALRRTRCCRRATRATGEAVRAFLGRTAARPAVREYLRTALQPSRRQSRAATTGI